MAEQAPAWLSFADSSELGYRQLLQAIESAVAEGSLLPGEKMPTHRDLSSALSVSRGTVARAYEEAKRLGLLQSGIGQGTFVAARETRSPFGPIPNQELNMGMSYPFSDRDPDPAPVLEALALDPRRRELFNYPVPDGTLAHREAGSHWLAQLGVEAKPEEVVMMAGAQHAIQMWLLSVVRPGGKVLAETLTYPMMPAAAKVANIEVLPVAMDDDGMIPEALAQRAEESEATGLYLIPNFQNPTTVSMSEKRRKALTKVIQAKKLQVFEDDINGPFLEQKTTPLKMLLPNRVTYAASLSKPVSGGLRMAYVVPPAAYYPSFVSSLNACFWAVSPICSEIAMRWIEDGTASASVAAKTAEYRERRTVLETTLGPVSRGLRTGANFAWLQLPEPWRAHDFSAEARRRGVVVMPAEVFSLDKARAPQSIRISLGTLSRPDFQKGVQILADILQTPGPFSPTVV